MASEWMYLLSLDGIIDSYPIGLYHSAEAAAAAAKAYGLTKDATLDALPEELAKRVDGTGYAMDDYGIPANLKVRGFGIIRFFGDAPVADATIGFYDRDTEALHPEPPITDEVEAEDSEDNALIRADDEPEWC